MASENEQSKIFINIIFFYIEQEQSYVISNETNILYTIQIE